MLQEAEGLGDSHRLALCVSTFLFYLLENCEFTYATDRETCEDGEVSILFQDRSDLLGSSREQRLLVALKTRGGAFRAEKTRPKFTYSEIRRTSSPGKTSQRLTSYAPRVNEHKADEDAGLWEQNRRTEGRRDAKYVSKLRKEESETGGVQE